ncbi:hypothetical protein M422DRAFT_232636 [Sphaerobolus stellatus SS14]|uniref:Protein DML1 n=1 Tax=Sphaerobolus stellatus (strain SS14) TaxID=990650 RepID=A0A0C9VFL2_SPHS4|nr:hypothetical protein M422DRAFT_232636 [Sphaerobolus stellatus SS14]
MVKEIIYIHTSTGYLATHFFNSEQAYFKYDHDGNEKETNSEVDPDISFKEGLAADGTSTYTPRAVIVDYKSRFGSLSHINALQSGQEAVPEAMDPIWSGSVAEYRQAAIPQSSYHAKLDAGEDDLEDIEMEAVVSDDLTSKVRFWSDFSRVFFQPRGLLRIPDPGEWEREPAWQRGAERYKELDDDAAIMDNVFRLFAEECDQLQGLQISLDAPSMGAFTIQLLTQIRDEYAKLPILSFCSLSPFDPSRIELDETAACISALNDVLTLHELASLTSVTVPLQHPSTWKRGLWSSHINADFRKQYHSSAVLSAHIESATLPLRLKATMPSSSDIASYCAHLNWRGDTPFSALSGAFPLPVAPTDIPKYTYDFTHPTSLHKVYLDTESFITLLTLETFAQKDVFRGCNATERASTEKWISEAYPELRPPFHSMAYLDQPFPIPTSYPQFFKNLGPTGRPEKRSQRRVHSVPVYSSLQTTPRTAGLARSYAEFTDNVGRRGFGLMNDLNVEREFVKEVSETWWGWVGSYGGEEDKEDERGEDE